MTVTRICPDDLVLAARSGMLSPQDEARLHLHLARCPQCQAAFEAGRAFDAVLGARVGDDAIAMRLAAHVTQRPARRWLAYAAGGGLLLLTGSVAVAAVGRETLQHWFVATEVATPPAVTDTPAASSPRRESKPEPNESAPIASAETAVSAPLPTASAIELAARPPRNVEVGETAAELFASANALRSQGKAAEAERRYLALQARYPATTEARVSLVSLARLELGSRPALALRHFDAYLGQSAHTTLAEEALFGRASALSRLGRVEAERTAWQLLLTRFPSSVYAERAKSRLASP